MSYRVHVPYMYCLDLHIPVLYMYVSTVDLAVDLVGRPILVGTDPAVQVISKSARFRQPDVADRARPRRPKGARTAGARSPTSRHMTNGDMVTSESDPSSIAALATSLRFKSNARAPSNMSVLDASSILVPWLIQPPRTCFRRRSLLCGPRCLPTRPSCVMQAIIGPDFLRPMLPSDLLDTATSAPRVLSPTAPSTSETVNQAPSDSSAPSAFADDPGVAIFNSCPSIASPSNGDSRVEAPDPS